MDELRETENSMIKAPKVSGKELAEMINRNPDAEYIVTFENVKTSKVHLGARRVVIRYEPDA